MVALPAYPLPKAIHESTVKKLTPQPTSPPVLSAVNQFFMPGSLHEPAETESWKSHFDKRDPKTGELMQRYAVISKDAFEAMAYQAKQAFLEWQDVSFAKRSELLNVLADQLMNDAEDWAQLISLETGKSLFEAYEADLMTSVSVLRFVAKAGPNALKPENIPLDKSALMGRFHTLHRRPRGVVGIISPWNYPLAIPVSGIASAVMGGNAVILKPSEHSPAVAECLVHNLQTLLAEMALPQKVVQLAIGDGQTGALMSQHPLIDYLIFTGSEKTGRKVQVAMQAQGKEVSLELGGCDAMVILPSAIQKPADLDVITSYAVWGRMANSGQSCAAVKRLYVARPHYKACLNLLLQKIEALQISPLVSHNQRREVMGQVEDAIQKGAKLMCGGTPLPDEIDKVIGYVYAPTLLADVPADARVLNEEVFGPVLPVVPFDTESGVIDAVNHTGHGLSTAIFGKPADAKRIAPKLNVGMVTVNDVGLPNYAVAGCPWISTGRSGPGVSHGVAGILSTTRPQVVSDNKSLQYPLLFPGMAKPFWHYAADNTTDRIEDSQALLNFFGTKSLVAKANPSKWAPFLQLLLNRASSTRR